MRRRGRRQLIGVVAAAIAALAAGAAPAAAVPSLGRWEARGDGGARVVWMVIGVGHRRYVASMVSFCGGRGYEEFDDWSQPNPPQLVDIGANGHFRTGEVGGAARLAGVLHERRGSVHAHPYALLAEDAGCPPSAFAHLRARFTGPAPAPDGIWRIVGTLGTTGFLHTYGGGSLVRWGGTFAGPPPPKYPELPCLPTAIVQRARVGRGGLLRSSYADALGAITRVSLSGAVRPTHAGGFYTSNIEYFD
jgi:hypothetical protein